MFSSTAIPPPILFDTTSKPHGPHSRMAQIRSQGPTPAGTAPATVPSKISAQVDLLVCLHLHSWPALTLAVQNGWGGDKQASADKRDWLAGAISELLTSTPAQIHDVGDLEEVLLQVMLDEFEIVVDDGSAEEVSKKIWASLQRVKDKDVRELGEMYARWQERQAKGGEKVVGIVRGEDKEGDDTDWDDEEHDVEEEWNGFPDGEDVDMGEAPQLVETEKNKQKLEPVVDEEGFTKVISKKRR